MEPQTDFYNYITLLKLVVKSSLAVRYENTASTELYVRCPYCGDSEKSERSAHFYIELAFPFRCYCQRCEAKRFLSTEVLKDLKIYDVNLQRETYIMEKERRFTNGNMKTEGSQFSFSVRRRELYIPEPLGTPEEIEKLEYLNERMKLNLTLDDVQTYKIILNFKDFCVQNEIGTFSANMDTIKNFNNYCIGFLSYDNNYIIFRSIVDKSITGFRYRNYNIFNEHENTKKFYVIPTNLDLLSPTVNVVISEGIIDMVGIHNHFFKDKSNLNNTIFISVNGKGYNLIFQYLARLGFIDMNIMIFSDDDVNINWYKRMKEDNPVLKLCKMKVFYNSIGKDYGVPVDKINLMYNTI